MNRNLRDNEDGTCNCQPLGNCCFFMSSDSGRCDCKCHNPKDALIEKIKREVDKLEPGVYGKGDLLEFLDSLK